MVRRERYLEKLGMYLHRDVVKIIIGARRSGKSTIIRQFIGDLKEDGVPEENIIYLDFESAIYAYMKETSQLRDMILDFLNGADGHSYIFLDEVEIIEGWAEVASELLNMFDCDIYVSASNSSVFTKDFSRLLNYRYVRIDVTPLTFSEYLIFAGEAGLITKDVEALGSDGAQQDGTAGGEAPGAQEGVTDTEGSEALAGPDRTELFIRYLGSGWMPGALFMKDEESAKDYLKGVYHTIILKDVVQCRNLRDVGHIDQIMEFVLNHMGETFSPKAVRDYIVSSGGSISVDTVYSCLDALTGAYLLYKLPRFDIKSERVLETQEKYYICDPLMRDAVMGDEGTALKTRMENAAVIEMFSRGFRLYVAKNGRSLIDVMAAKGGDRTYINLSESVSDRTAEKEAFGPLERIRDNYFKMVLSLDRSTIVNRRGIVNYPIAEFFG